MGSGRGTMRLDSLIVPLLPLLLLIMMMSCLAGAQQCNEIFDGVRGLVSEAVLSAVDNDVQKIVDCTPAGGELAFDASLKVELENPVVLAKSIVVRGTGSKNNRPTFTCAEGVPAFVLESHGIELQNLIISDCVLGSNVSASVVIDAPQVPKRRENQVDPIIFLDVDFVENKNANGTGGVHIGSAETVEFQGVLFFRNSGFDGGAVTIDAPDVKVDFRNCLFEWNSAANVGGALNQNSSAFLTITRSIFRHNEAVEAAAGIHIKGEPPQSRAVLRNTEFWNNTVYQFVGQGPLLGGGVLAKGPTLELRVLACNFTNNFAMHQGGGLMIAGSRRPGGVVAKVENTVFTGNGALWGGAMHASSIRRKMELKISGCEFRENVGTLLRRDTPQLANVEDVVTLDPGKGGALLSTGARVKIHCEDSLFENNSASTPGGPGQLGPLGGALALLDTSDATFVDTIFRNNSATSDGDEGLPGGGGAVHIEAAGENIARVIGAPEGSECAEQCDQDLGARIGLSDNLDGCARTDTATDRICVITNPETCKGLQLKEYSLPDEDYFTAACQVLTSNSSITFTRVDFIQNTVQGDGGAILISDIAVDVELGAAVKFVGNDARGGNGGAIAIESGARLSAFGTIFEKNRGSMGGAVSLKDADSTLTAVGTSFEQNRALVGSGGAIFISEKNARLSLPESPTFFKNAAGDSGGAIGVIGENHIIRADGASFVDNYARKAGGAVSIESYSGGLRAHMQDVSMIRNKILGPKPSASEKFGVGGAISTMGSGVSLVINGTKNDFSRNVAREGGAIRAFDPSSVKIANAKFKKNAALSGGAIHGTFTSKSLEKTLTMDFVEFLENTAFIGGGLMVDAKNANESFVPEDGLSQSVFLQPSGGGDLTIQLDLSDIAFRGQKTVQDGGGMLLVDVHASCTRCTFVGNKVDKLFSGSGGGITLSNLAVLLLAESEVTQNTAVKGAGISLHNSALEADFLNITRNTATGSGGGVFVTALENMGRPSLVLRESRVEKNVASYGGGVFLRVVEQASLTSCTNTENATRRGTSQEFDQILSLVADVCSAEMNGLGLSTSGEEIDGHRALSTGAVLVDTKLTENFASSAGGGLFTTHPNSLCICCGQDCSPSCALKEFLPLGKVCEEQWLDNRHGKGGYGQRIASVETDSQIYGPTHMLVKEGETFEVEHTSGEPLDELNVKIIDAFDQVVTTTGADFFVRVQSEEGILSGQVDKEVKQGVAKFELIVVSARPSEYLLTLTFTSPFMIREQVVKMTVRNCTRGEMEIDGNRVNAFRCEKCPRKTFSFHPKGPCVECPSEADCDGSSIIPEDGYWHSTSFSSQIHSCLLKQACEYEDRSKALLYASLNASNALRYDEGYPLCSEGYQGVLCGSCEAGYGRVRTFECEKCTSWSSSIAVTIAGLVWILLVLAFIIMKALTAVQRSEVGSIQPNSLRVHPPENSLSLGRAMSTDLMYLGVNPMTENAKILINFLQVSSIALSVNVTWRKEVRSMLALGDLLSGLSSGSGFLSLDCPLSASNHVPVSIQRSMFSLLVPLGFMALFCTYWFLLSRARNKDYEFFCRHALVSAIVVVYVFYTGITKRVLRILHSVEVDTVDDSEHVLATETYWADDTRLRFFKGSHAHLAGILGIPMLLIFSLGFPLALTYELWKRKSERNEKKFASTYGFLYRAYQSRYAYWEMVVLARKSLLVAVVVFIYPLGGNLQGIFALMVLVAAMSLHLFAMPYSEVVYRMNHRETLSLCGSTFMYMVGIAFNDPQLPECAKIVLSVLVISLTTAIVVYLLVTLVLEGARHIDTLLGTRGIKVSTNASTVYKAGVLMNCYWNKMISILSNFFHFHSTSGPMESESKHEMEQCG